MKTKILPVIICTAFTGFTVTSNAQANQSLSNLTSPTAVNQSLLPSTAHSKNLGSSSNQWQYLYLYGRIYINGALTMHAHGTQNFFAGPYAGNISVTGIDNTGTGEYALTKITSGNDNTANGLNALYYNTTGDYNSATGSYALYSTTEGASSNTADGANSLLNNTAGSYNTAVGASALTYAKSGNYNTAVGFAAFPTTNSYQNSTALGYEAIISASNQVRIGNSSITSIGGYTNWSNISDGRVKKNIKSNVPGLAFINQLNAVTYNLDLDAADKILQPPALKDKDEKVPQPSQQEITARKEKEQIIYSGFIAQDVEAAAKKIGYDFSGIDAPKNDNNVYGLRYSDFVVPLVKAVQELSKQNDSLKKEYDAKFTAQQNEIDELKAMIVSNQS
ncbi:MAG TPA: tail fiber domain-containing protein, partial [Parafilimonas sp.]